LCGAVLFLFGVVSFGWLYPKLQPRYENLVASQSTTGGGQWQPFSLEQLKRVAVDAGRTVLVDFSADWCASCKVLEAAVLHTEPVEQAIVETGAVTMYADFTRYPPEIKDTIHALRSNGVPVIAIFPGDRPYEPIVFRGGYTQAGLIDALEQATGRRLRTNGTVAEATAAATPLN
jgi:thiol:disulfide interchange protein DsbD